MFHRRFWVRVLLVAGCVALVLVIGWTLMLAHAQQSPEASGLSDRSWQLVAFTLDGQTQPLVPNTTITLRFGPEVGHISGSNGCNSYGATYTASSGHLHLDQFYQTLVGCLASGVMDQEARYMNALQSMTTYAFDATSRLMLRDSAGHITLLYRPIATSWRHPEPPNPPAEGMNIHWLASSSCSGSTGGCHSSSTSTARGWGCSGRGGRSGPSQSRLGLPFQLGVDPGPWTQGELG